MSADLELFKDLAKIQLPKLRIQSSNEKKGIVIDHQEENKINQDHVESSSRSECSTPTSVENKIPPVLTCPPAPRKPSKRQVSCKRKLSEIEFFEIVNREEVDAFFKEAAGFDHDSTSISKRSFATKNGGLPTDITDGINPVGNYRRIDDENFDHEHTKQY